MKRVVCLLSAAILFAGCADDVSGPGATEPVDSVALTPSSVTMTVGSTRTLVATPRARDGRALEGRETRWESSNTAVATVSATGVVTAVAVGTARVAATAGNRRSEAQVVVTHPPVAGASLDRTTAALAEGETLQLVLTVRDSAGNPISGLGVQWSSSIPGIAHVDALGRVTAIRPGSATITARVHGIDALAQVTVTADYPYDLLYTANTAAGFPELFLVNVSQPAAPAVAPFPAGSWAAAPAPSPDGTRVAFVCMSSFGDPSICVASRNGTGRVIVATEVGRMKGDPAWNASGTRIAYTEIAPDGSARIRVMDADGSNDSVLTAGMAGRQTGPAWSPVLGGGEERIAFASGTDAAQRIYTMRADGTDVRAITSAGNVDSAPAWSPDGLTLAFQRISATVYGDIWLVAADGTDERTLTFNLAGVQHSPAWSPDGRLLAFVSSHETGVAPAQVYTIWADGSKAARRTFDASGKAAPAWLNRP